MTTKGQDSLIGVYRGSYIITTWELEIKSENQFTLREDVNVYPQPFWTGKWILTNDTLYLDYDVDSMTTDTHIVESSFYLRTNLKKSIVNDSTFELHSPNYMYKVIGKYPNGNIKSQLTWQSISAFNFTPTREGTWLFYYDQGGIERVERYKKGLKHGSWIYLDKYGYCKREVKWKKGELKKEKDCNQQRL